MSEIQTIPKRRAIHCDACGSMKVNGFKSTPVIRFYKCKKCNHITRVMRV